jgi:AcrR family transcriptional regulator
VTGSILRPRPVVGRPRSPAVNRRAIMAAVELYGEKGWSAVSIETVARRSGISKQSIYLRWPNKEALLSHALNECMSVVSELNTGTLRSDLIELTRQLVELYAGPIGPAALRLAFESGPHGAAAIRERIRRSQVQAARSLVRRAVLAGELAPGTSPTLLLDTVCGAALNHVITTPDRLRPRVFRRAVPYSAELVDFIIHGLDTNTAQPSKRKNR